MVEGEMEGLWDKMMGESVLGYFLLHVTWSAAATKNTQQLQQPARGLERREQKGGRGKDTGVEGELIGENGLANMNGR